MNDPRIGIIGLGLLGSALAERLSSTGFSIVGYDIDAERCSVAASAGAEIAESPAEVARSAARILLSLPDSTVVRDVVEQLRPALRANAIIIDTTTGDPECLPATGRRLDAQDVRYIDATIAGSSQQARRGEVLVMAGGDAKAFAACSDIFDAFATQAFHLGPTGSGARMKLVVNLVLGLSRAALAEGLAFAQALDMDPANALEVLKASPAYSRVMDTKGEKMVASDFTPQARLAQHLKDVRLIVGQAERTGATLPLSELHRALLERLVLDGYGDEDNSAVIRAFQ